MSPPDINTSIHVKYVHVNAFIDLLALVHVLMREILCEPQVNQHPWTWNGKVSSFHVVVKYKFQFSTSTSNFRIINIFTDFLFFVTFYSHKLHLKFWKGKIQSFILQYEWSIFFDILSKVRSYLIRNNNLRSVTYKWITCKIPSVMI